MTLFDNEDQPLFDGDTSIDPNTNYFEVLVGEGKKFKTPEELARGKAEADAYIAKLIGELTELKGEVTSRKRLEELVDQLGSRVATSPTNEDTSLREPDGDKSSPPDVRKLLDEALTERERESNRKQNLATVKLTLQEKLGPGYASILRQQAPALGMTAEELTNLAAEKPKAFFRLVGIEQASKPEGLFTPPPSAQTTTKPQSTDRNYKFWSTLRKENPTEYWRRQTDMHADAKRLGPDFYN